MNFTGLSSFSFRMTISHDWQSPIPFLLMMPLIEELDPILDASITDDDIDAALERRMPSICGRNGPPKTTYKFYNNTELYLSMCL